MLKGNKGEWSEIYTLLKLLGDTEIYVGDENLNKIPDLLYPIIKILRDESDGHFEYSINDDLIFISGKNEEFKISIINFKNKAELLLAKIKEANTSSFEVPEIEEFLSQIHCSTLKAKSSSKTDIRIVIHDLKTNLQPELGFSIKSQLGGASTLLNAGKTTNFIYKIENCNLTNDFIEEINSVETRSKIKDRLEAINSKSCKVKFTKTEKEVFENNLILIDSLLPNILSEIVFEFFTSNLSEIKDLVENLEDKNPLNFNTSNNHKFYEYKIKKFLTEVALGMMPATVWNGIYDATGGYLVVKNDGEILSYHIYNKNKFENYLYHNTKLETASSSRHDFGKIFEENGEYFIKLNLQIRFKK
jgi:type II restriction enzyme